MKIGIITAMPEEFRAVKISLGTTSALQSGVSGIEHFSAGGHEFLLVQSGMSFTNAAGAAEMLIHNEHPNLLISTGFCGAIMPDLQVGDVVVAEQIVIAGARGLEEVPVQLSGIGKTFAARQAIEGNRVFGGTFVSTPVIMSKKSLATLMAEHFTNLVVEMESAAVAIVAAENNIPLLAIRAVSDAAAEELQFSLNEFCAADMRRILMHKILLTILKKPRIISQLFRLSRSSRTAAESLTAAFTRLFPLL
jgi:adenosylhomocysteine nucleosidase